MNGTTPHSPSRPFLPGVYAPLPTFFHPDSEELDLPTFETHVLRMARAGVGLVISGSMGEGHHLSPSERQSLIRTARRVLDSAHEPSLAHVPIIAGTGAGSTRESIRLSREAAEAGADIAIVIVSGYFAAALDKHALKAYWTEIADKSPIPVLLYNYPGASGGIDVDSDTIEDLARTCPNLCGVKLTCGNVGKLTRIAASVSPPSFAKSFPRRNKEAPFLVLGGYADFLVPSLFANAHGAITGLANVAPHTLRRLFDLASQAQHDPPSTGTLAAAQSLQGIVARADRTIALTGIAGTKDLLTRLYGYGGVPRRPLGPVKEGEGERLWAHEHVVELVKEERRIVAEMGTAGEI